ncbi:MAG TPA: head GIN domain-containing protein [Segetibacter sp.]
MKRIVLMLLITISGLVAKSQNVVYDENAEVRVVEKFSGVDLSGSVTLYLSQGNTQGVAVSAGEAKYNSKIKTEVRNGVLHISVDGGMWNGFNWTNKKLKAYVTVTDLNSIGVSGASLVNITGPVKGTDLRLEVSGASEIKGIINVSRLNLDVSGASVARLSGSATEGLINGSGACRVNSYDLSIDRCKVSSSGASSVRVTVNSELNADASGGSNIYYKGSGTVKVLNTSGGATIKNRSGNDD